MIEMDKQYVTVIGNRPVRVLCVNRVGKLPVIVLLENGAIYGLTEKGFLLFDDPQPFIKEYDPMEEVKKLPVDAPIWVRYTPSGQWLPRHFSHVAEGRVYTWDAGRTSHTGKVQSGWGKWSINKPEEL